MSFGQFLGMLLVVPDVPWNPLPVNGLQLNCIPCDARTRSDEQANQKCKVHANNLGDCDVPANYCYLGTHHVTSGVITIALLYCRGVGLGIGAGRPVAHRQFVPVLMTSQVHRSLHLIRTRPPNLRFDCLPTWAPLYLFS